MWAGVRVLYLLGQQLLNTSRRSKVLVPYSTAFIFGGGRTRAPTCSAIRSAALHDRILAAQPNNQFQACSSAGPTPILTIALTLFDCWLFRFWVFHTSTFKFLDKPWSQVSSLLSPGSCIQFLSRIGSSNRRLFIDYC